MHHPPDLNLASSYIPACLCVMKCTFAFVLFVFSPMRGWIGLSCLVIMDRILWNNHQTTVLDVNAVVFALIGGLMVMHTRSEGVHTMFNTAVVGVWILVSAAQVISLTRLSRSYEIILGGCCIAILSCLYQAQERTELLALRAFVFVVANTTLPYLGVMMQQSEIDTYVNASRTLLIILGEPEVSCTWIVLYVLCMGYQIRSSSSKRTETISCTPSSVVVQQAKAPPPTPSADEAALLREALASRRGGFREQ